MTMSATAHTYNNAQHHCKILNEALLLFWLKSERHTNDADLEVLANFQIRFAAMPGGVPV